MRLYYNGLEALRECERDLWEMGIEVHPQTMQDKDVANDPNFNTKELQGYDYKIMGPYDASDENRIIGYMFPGKERQIKDYINQEHLDRISGESLNPGNSWKLRSEVWAQFIHEGKFSYTYSERFQAQFGRIMVELTERPNTRQAIITIHSNIECAEGKNTGTYPSRDQMNMGGKGRIPCSMYYQAMIRNGALDLIYTMRSCDFLTHFPIDLCLARKLQSYMAGELGLNTGVFTHFIGSFHAYEGDMRERGIF